MSTQLSKYVEEDLDNHLETIFAEMMDDGFNIRKKLYNEDNVLDLIITKRFSGSTGMIFRIETYENQIRELLDILSRRNIQLLGALFYTKTSSFSVRDFESNTNFKADFRDKSVQEFWDSLRFSIYSSSEYDDITNLTMTFFSKK